MAVGRGVPLDEVAGADGEAVGVGDEQLPMRLAQAIVAAYPARHHHAPLASGAKLLEAALVGAAVPVEKQPDAHPAFDRAGKQPAETGSRLVDGDVEPCRRGLQEAVQQRARRVRPERAGESAHDVPTQRALSSMRGPQ